MAALGDEVLDGFMYPTCAAYSYSYPYPAAAKGGGGWRPRSGGCPASSSSSSPRAAPAFPGCGQLTAAEYLDSYQRAQLTALLSQVSPGLAARPRRAGSRDAAVQVNPRRDVSVQCSLGRRSLPRRARDPDPGPAGAGPQGAAGGSAPPRPARRGPAHGSPPGGGPRPVRFPRTVAVYSPVVSRCLTALLHGAETAPDAEPAPPPRPRGPEQRERAAREAPQPAEEAEARAAVRASWEQPAAGPALPPREPRAGEGAPRRAPGSPEQPPPRGAAQDAEGEKAPPRSLEPGKERPRFQVRPEAPADRPGARSRPCPRGPPGARGGAGLPEARGTFVCLSAAVDGCTCHLSLTVALIALLAATVKHQRHRLARERRTFNILSVFAVKPWSWARSPVLTARSGGIGWVAAEQQ